MRFQEFKLCVSQLSIGKRLPSAVYLHKSALEVTSPELFDLTKQIVKALKISPRTWNIVKFSKRDFKITLLNYPDFDVYAYPALHHSQTIDLTKLTVRKANYAKSDNPPILHRKETFVLSNYPGLGIFSDITREGEEIGLYDNPKSIGFKKNWSRLIRSKACYLDDEGRIHRKSKIATQSSESINCEIQRHKTAIDRNSLSAPMSVLARHGYLDGNHSILDYGCGKGDDVRELQAHGIDVTGWDPVHNPEGEVSHCAIVNLGFVINVIENIDERNDTLRTAFGLADRLLIASVMVASEKTISHFAPYKDGVITSLNTFQRYYTQAEFKEYLQTTLDEKAVAVGQGIFIVFKDKLEEQLFLLQRQHISRNWNQITQREVRTETKTITKNLIEKHQVLFDHFWETTLDLGRIPANVEFELSDRIRAVAGSHKKAFDALIEQRGKALYLEAQQARINDLLVYFALGQFDKRKPYSQMPEGLKRDIKIHFHSYNQAIHEATKLLFSVGNPLIIRDAAKDAYEKHHVGEFNEGHSWVIPKQLLSCLPAELRIYVGCACQIYGDLDDMHLIKIHFNSGKVSLMRYDDFEKDEPLLLQRIKIKILDLDVDFFDYGNEYPTTPLLNKYIYSNST